MNTHRTFFFSLVFLAIPTLHSPLAARAAIVVIDFDSATTGSLLTADYLEDGYKMQSLSGHYDIFSAGGTGNTQYLGLDTVVGPSSVVRFTNIAGENFNLLSLDVMYTPDPNFPLFEQQTITSSAGGSMSLSAAGIQNFSGPGWTNLAWINISSNVAIITLPVAAGFDTITLQTAVPLPPALLLFGSGLMGLLGLACRKAA